MNVNGHDLTVFSEKTQIVDIDDFSDKDLALPEDKQEKQIFVS